MNNIDMSRMKVISVLIFTYTNNVRIQVTRAEGFHTFPAVGKNYIISYDSPIINSMVHWAAKLNELVTFKIIEAYGHANGTKES